MTRVINCECGQTIHGESDDELIQKAQAHVDASHPELVGKLSREDILAMAEER
jgi:predicted small metal-binding protein